MNLFNDQVNYWAHMLDESCGEEQSNEQVVSESLEEHIQPKANIVCIQCLFRNLLTKNLLDVQTELVNTSNRKGLDFEMYFQVSGETMKRLLNAKVLVSNIKDIKPLVDTEQIVDILASSEPVAAFLTDSYGDTIIDEVMSPASQLILKQRNAQSPTVGAFKFSFFNADYDVLWRKLYGVVGSNELLKPRSFTSVWKRGKEDSLKIGDKIVQKDSMVVAPVYLIGGYWNKISWNSELEQFEVDKSQEAKTAIPALKMRIKGREATALWEATKTLDQIDNSKLNDFIGAAVKKSVESGNDLRARAAHGSEEFDEADDITSDIMAEDIQKLVDDNLQKMLEFGDEFYDVEVLNDCLKLVIAGDARVIDADEKEEGSEDFFQFTSDFDASGVERLCSSINSLLAENGINVKYRVEKEDIANTEKTLRESVHQEYCSTGKLNVRYACDITLRLCVGNAIGEDKTLDEGVKNKILGWFGARSSWTELEDAMDKFYEKVAKNGDKANADTFPFKVIAKEVMKDKEVKERIHEVISKATGTASESLNSYFEEIRNAVLWTVMRKVGKDHMRKNKCRYEAAIRMITKRILTEISTRFSDAGKRAYAKYSAEMERQRKEEEERRKAWLKANYKPGFQSKYDDLPKEVAKNGLAALG